MRRAIATGAALAMLAVPATAAAKPHDPTAPTRAELRAAAQQCHAERGTTPDEHRAFLRKYGTNRNHRNAFGRCVRRHAHHAAKKRRAIRACRQELRKLGPEEFRAKYADENGGNAFRNCVRAKLAGPGHDERPPTDRPPTDPPTVDGERGDDPSPAVERRADPPPARSRS